MVSLESKLEKITWQIVNLLFEEENTFFFKFCARIYLSTSAPRIAQDKTLCFLFFFFLTFWT